MVSITLSIPEKTRKLMKRFPEMNWSQFVRSCIDEKTKQLSWKEKMLKKLQEEDKSGFTDWTVKLGKDARKDRFKELQRKGLV